MGSTAAPRQQQVVSAADKNIVVIIDTDPEPPSMIAAIDLPAGRPFDLTLQAARRMCISAPVIPGNQHGLLFILTGNRQGHPSGRLEIHRAAFDVQVNLLHDVLASSLRA